MQINSNYCNFFFHLNKILSKVVKLFEPLLSGIVICWTIRFRVVFMFIVNLQVLFMHNFFLLFLYCLSLFIF